MWLDIYLRNQRFVHAKPYVRRGDVLLDVSCEDGALFRYLEGLIKQGIGIDPLLQTKGEAGSYILYPGMFPKDLPPGIKCDVITMLAVLEHIPPAEQQLLAKRCHSLLNPGGRVIITVPSPRVDYILHVLRALQLVEADTLHQHYGFKVEVTGMLFFPPLFRLLRKRKFQLGLNNLFVFERLEG